MYYGACAQRDDVELFFCFHDKYDLQSSKKCHRSTGPLKDVVDKVLDIKNHFVNC